VVGQTVTGIVSLTNLIMVRTAFTVASRHLISPLLSKMPHAARQYSHRLASSSWFYSALIRTAHRPKVNAQRTKFTIQVCSFHSDSLCELADFAIA